MSFRETIPLLAAADWWQIVAGLIFFVLYGIGQLMGAREEAQKKKAQPRRPKPQPPQPGAPDGPPNQADPLRAEVEEFLRRVQGKPAQQQQPARPEPTRTRRQPIARQLPIEPSPLREAASRPKPQPAQPVDLRRESVTEHTARHVNTREIAEHTSRLGEEVALADDHLESHLQETFSHKIGSLQHREREVVEQAPTAVEEFRKLLSHPTGMRQMIVASEILRRPEDRWQ